MQSETLDWKSGVRGRRRLLIESAVLVLPPAGGFGRQRPAVDLSRPAKQAAGRALEREEARLNERRCWTPELRAVLSGPWQEETPTGGRAGAPRC